MTSMTGDIVNRVKRLPKPSLAAEALQPIFEAVSNALHAVEDMFGDQFQQNGRINVTIKEPRTPSAIEIVVADNGVGLDTRGVRISRSERPGERDARKKGRDDDFERER